MNVFAFIYVFTFLCFLRWTSVSIYVYGASFSCRLARACVTLAHVWTFTGGDVEVTSDQEVSSVHWPTAVYSNGKPQLQKPQQQQLISVQK